MKCSYINRLVGAFSRAINVMVFNGHPSESLSARVYRHTLERPTRKTPRVIRQVIDTVFWWDYSHCMEAYFTDRRWAMSRLKTHFTNIN